MSARRLACRRGGRLLFEELDFEIHVGQIAWLRGHNGRGKTSLLRLAGGLGRPERGAVAGGKEAVFIGHANALKDDLSVQEALSFLLRLNGRAFDHVTVHGALERFGLLGVRHALVRTLSQGQRRRAALARLAAMPSPPLWLLDEPFDALDADGVQRLNGLLREHARRGGTVLLASHLPLEAGLASFEIDLDALA